MDRVRVWVRVTVTVRVGVRVRVGLGKRFKSGFVYQPVSPVTHLSRSI